MDAVKPTNRELTTDGSPVAKSENTEDIETDEQLFKIFAKEKEEKFSLSEYASGILKSICVCSASNMKKLVHSVLPVSEWLPLYKMRDNLPRDVAAGITVGVVHLPQGMAYSSLAGLPAVNGLYVSFFPVLIYVLLGSTPHLSIGTFAVVSLMIGAAIDKHIPASSCVEVTTTSSPLMPENSTLIANATTAPNFDRVAYCVENQQRNIEIAVALSVAVALIHFVMYILRLGIINVYLSSHLVSGFTCGAAFHVLTSQVPKLFGIKVPRKSGVLSIIYTYVDFFKMITTIIWATVLVSLCCIIVLAVGKEINRRFSKKLPFPIPWELVVVIFATLASQFGYFKPNYDVSVVGNIPTGIKTSLPSGSDIGMVMIDAIPIAIVIFCISISLSTLFSEKHAYDVNPNQELLAYAVANTFGSFFQCFPSSASLSRSLVWEQSGGKTQITGLVSSILILITLLWIGPLFEQLPDAALAAIIVVNLKNMLIQFNQLKPLWKISKLDAITWCVTWLSVFLLGVDLGLYVGVAFSLFTVVLRTQLTFGNTMVLVSHAGVYRSSKRFQGVSEEDILVFKFPSPLIYANQERFKNQLAVSLGFNPAFEIALRKMADEKAKTTEAKKQQPYKVSERHENELAMDELGDKEKPLHEDETSSPENDSHTEIKIVHQNPVSHALNVPCTSVNLRESSEELDSSRMTKTGVKMPLYVILDMSICCFIDNDGVANIKALYQRLSKLDIQLLLARCTADVRRCLMSGNFPPKSENPEENRPVFFISVKKAVKYSKSNKLTPERREEITAIGNSLSDQGSNSSKTINQEV